MVGCLNCPRQSIGGRSADPPTNQGFVQSFTLGAQPAGQRRCATRCAVRPVPQPGRCSFVPFKLPELMGTALTALFSGAKSTMCGAFLFAAHSARSPHMQWLPAVDPIGHGKKRGDKRRCRHGSMPHSHLFIVHCSLMPVPPLEISL